jgi:hypothetical protein
MSRGRKLTPRLEKGIAKWVVYELARGAKSEAVTAEAMEKFGVSRATIYRALDRHGIPWVIALRVDEHFAGDKPGFAQEWCRRVLNGEISLT